jgi:rubrerythrin
MSIPQSENNAGQSKPVETTSQKTAEKAIYFCPMDNDVVSDKPEKCPKCGMDLIKKQ